MNGAGRRAPLSVASLGVLTAVRRVVAVGVLLGLLPVTAGLLVCAAALSWPGSLRGGGRWRAVRVLWVALVYLAVDLAGVVAGTAMWLRRMPYSPGNRARLTAATYGLLERLLGTLRRVASRAFGVVVDVTPGIPVPAVAGAGGGGPVVLFARHAGPGDSFLLVHTLLADAGLRPAVVLKRMLRFDPCLDMLLGRLPHCWIPAPRGVSAAGTMAALASRLGDGDALVLFPEGGNFTERRRDRAVASLRRHGLGRVARLAEAMPHVLPPRTSGALAVLEAAPTADVVFVAHTGLDTIDSARTGWAALPLRERVRVHWWRIPASAVPAGDAARTEWLMRQWARVDAWIDGNAPGTAPR